MATTGLIVIEHFRRAYPLKEEDYLTPSRGSVKQSSGKRATNIARRFAPNARHLGTETGRTSRATPKAATRLADALNELQLNDASEELRARLADVMQQWLVDHPLNDYWSRQRLEPNISLAQTMATTIGELLSKAIERGGTAPGAVAQHLVGAKLVLRFGEESVPNHNYAAADTVTGRAGDFQIGDTIFHVTMAPGQLVIEKCQENLKDGFRAILLVPNERTDAARQLAALQGVEDHVEVLAIETFVGQNVEELSKFEAGELRVQLKLLLETYNKRVNEVEPDKSLQFEIPANL